MKLIGQGIQKLQLEWDRQTGTEVTENITPSKGRGVSWLHFAIQV